MNEQNSQYRIVRYLSKGKPTDRFIFSQVHFTSLHNQTVVLICFVEIANPWHPAREGAQIISQQLLREFNRSENQSTITRFENALKSLNSTLSDLEDRVETSINCAVLALTKNEVHFSTIGQARVLLAHHKNINDVAAEQDNSRRTNFAAVTSGDLSENDWLFCASDAFFQTAKEVNPDVWSRQNEKELFNELASLAETESLPLMTAISLRISPDSPSQESYFWEENEQRLPIRLPKFNIDTSSLPRPKFNMGWIKKVGQDLLQFKKRDNSRTKETKNDQYLPGPSSNSGGFRSFLMRAKKTFFPGKLTRKNIWPILAAVAFIILLVVGIGIIRSNFKKSLKADVPAQTLTDQIRGVSTDQVASILKDKFTNDSYQSLSDFQKAELVTILASSKITLLDKPAVLSEVANPVIKTAVSATNQIYSLDSTGQIWRFDGKINNKISQQTLIQQPIDMVVLSDQKIVASDATGNIWLFDGTPTQPKSLALPSKLASGKKLLQAYQGNLYLMPVDGSIYKVTNFDNTLDSAALSTKAGTMTFANPDDWLITGQVYAVSQTGQLINWSKSKLGSVNTPLLPTLGTYHLAGNTNEIVITSGPLIWRYTAAGVLVKTYYLASEKTISNIEYVSGSQYLVAIGTQLFQLNLN